MSAVRIVLVLCGGLFLVLGTLLPNDGDLWWQNWLGQLILQTHRLPTNLGRETFTASGAPWVPQEWLLSIVIAATLKTGWFVAVKVLAATIPIAILLSVYWRSRGRAVNEAVAVALLCCAIALQGSFGVRAQVFGWGCFAMFLLLLERRGATYYLAILTVAIWANVHASALLAPVFLAARVAGEAADDGWVGLRSSRDLRILPLTIAALFCTPLGWHLPVYSLELATSPIRQYIQEWQPVSLGDAEFLFGALPIALMVAFNGLKVLLRKKADLAPIAVLFVAMMLARRNVPLFAIAAGPLAAVGLGARFPGLSRLSNKISELERFALVSVCVALLAAGAVSFVGKAHAKPSVPTAAIARLAASGRHRLFCENFSACSVALQYSDIRVFMDGRCDPYPLDVWRSYVQTIRADERWSRILSRYNVDSVLASEGSRFSKALAASGDWRTAFSDGTYVLYLRT